MIDNPYKKAASRRRLNFNVSVDDADTLRAVLRHGDLTAILARVVQTLAVTARRNRWGRNDRPEVERWVEERL